MVTGRFPTNWLDIHVAILLFFVLLVTVTHGHTQHGGKRLSKHHRHSGGVHNRNHERHAHHFKRDSQNKEKESQNKEKEIIMKGLNLDVKKTENQIISKHVATAQDENGKTVKVHHGTHEWSYRGENGPFHWGDNFAKCTGQRQSPINIAIDHTYFSNDLGTIKFSADYFKEPKGNSWTIKNNGHSVTIVPTSGRYSISGKGLPGTFRLVQFHFHWGSDTEQGSEHSINGKRYPMEAHFVHFNTRYKTLAKAMEQPDGLAVLGLFFQVTQAENKAMQEITRNLKKVTVAGTQRSIKSLNLNHIMGGDSDMDKYYRYQGSLTTPGCFETVTWTILSMPRNISIIQLEQFRALQTTDKKPLVDNFRPIQPVYNRQIRRSFELGCHMALNGVLDWDYGEINGPAQWPKMFPKCGKSHQSPINIKTEEADVLSLLTPLEFSDDYSRYKVGSWTLLNSGHSVVVVPTTGNFLVSGGGLPGTYKLAEISFHWSSNEEEGSEHTIDGQTQPMEMQLMHYNTRDKSYEEAKKRRDGLAGLSFFFEVGRFSNRYLDPVVKKLPILGNSTTKALISSVNLMKLMGGKSNLKEYYRYKGSMTTPPCEQSVVWTVFPNPVELSISQLTRFQSVTSLGKIIQGNFRPVQPANSRLVSRSEILDDED